MKMPVAFQLTPEIWIPIKWQKNMPDDDFGQYIYDLDGGYINMSLEMDVKHMDMVLLHEIRHCYFANCGYADLLKSFSPELEESVNEFIDFMLRGIVKINQDSKRFRWREIDI